MQVLRGFNGLAPKHSSKPGHAGQSLHALPARPRMRCAAGVAPESSGEVVSGQQVTYSAAPYFSAASAQSVSMDDSGRARTDYGFGFSAGGLLFPYFLGISEQLQSMNVLLPETPVAGASAGSIIAVCAKSGLSEEELLVAFLDLARDCRQGGTRTRLKSVLRRVLEKALPDDIHERCNGRAHLAVTRLWPEFTPQTISSFRSRTDVIDTLLTSSHIPYWFDGSLFTMYRSGVYFDGGITNFIPSTPTDVCYRVSCFPSQQLKAFKGISLSPDTFEQWPHDMGTMLGWAFEPAPEDMLLKLVEKGKRDARSWALANVPVEQLQLAGGGR